MARTRLQRLRSKTPAPCPAQPHDGRRGGGMARACVVVAALYCFSCGEPVPPNVSDHGSTGGKPTTRVEDSQARGSSGGTSNIAGANSSRAAGSQAVLVAAGGDGKNHRESGEGGASKSEGVTATGGWKDAPTTIDTGGTSAENSTSAPTKWNPSGMQTLVLVRHAETMANLCEDACADNTCCRSDVCSLGCDNDCNCDANLRSFSPRGKSNAGMTLVNNLKSLNLKWDKVIVSPAWRTQTTIKQYLETEDLRGEIVPELDECWNEDEGTCESPVWESEPYEIIPFADGVRRLSPRAVRPDWDAQAIAGSFPSYDHSESNAACENIIMDRAREYTEKLFSDGATSVLAVTHAMTGEGLLARLTGSRDYDLENAPAYTVLKRSVGSKTWQVVASNATAPSP